MPSVGFEPMIPVFERAKTDHAFDRAATVSTTCVSNVFKYNILLYYHSAFSSMGLFVISCRMFYGLSPNHFEGKTYILGSHHHQSHFFS
jgi:hypothetical protein